MKRSAWHLLAACLVTVLAGAGPEAIAASQGGAVQELSLPKASGKVHAVFWSRKDDSYALQLRIPPAFVGNTIACLRGLDPTFGRRTLAMVDGRPQVSTTPDPSQQPAAMQAGPSAEDLRRAGVSPNIEEALRALVPRNIAFYQPELTGVDQASGVAESYGVLSRPPKAVQVWLLRADGTMILPASRSDDIVSRDDSCEVTNRVRQSRLSARGAEASPSNIYYDEIRYRFPLVAGEQAIAVAIRLDDDFYIEKLQPGPAVQ